MEKRVIQKSSQCHNHHVSISTKWVVLQMKKLASNNLDFEFLSKTTILLTQNRVVCSIWNCRDNVENIMNNYKWNSGKNAKTQRRLLWLICLHISIHLQFSFMLSSIYFTLHRRLPEARHHSWSLLHVYRGNWTPGEREFVLLTVHWC